MKCLKMKPRVVLWPTHSHDHHDRESLMFPALYKSCRHRKFYKLLLLKFQLESKCELHLGRGSVSPSRECWEMLVPKFTHTLVPQDSCFSFNIII